MSNDRIWILLGKQLSGDIDAEELKELELLLKGNPEALTSRELAAKIWQAPIQEASAALESQQRVWDTVSPQLQQRRRPIVRRMVTATAAAAMLAAVWTGWEYMRSPSPALQQFSSAPGGKSRLVLPDGSVVLLNANTRLQYEKNGFGKQQRDVVLSGEAFFDIAQSEGIPFIIHAEKVNIRVLGTSFNVKAYAADSIVATTLVRGKVAVTYGDKTLVLRPEERLAIPVRRAAAVLQQQRLEKDSSGQLPDISWLNNKLAFDNNTFAELAGKMSQWYGVTFHFESNAMQQLRFSGIINTESLEEALHMLQLSRPFNFRINGKDVYISN